ncbi:MAG: peptidyl-prolyl cis-trans isomerase A (cyclophilin A) [Oleispira sp.]|mgnify:FL=1|jgi:peptidyl-prolyl cis-trans isomerase A (cyclophilin A)|tara:strand:- start:675 stop:1295 length:621 start_codon:yes stop_codon:yes gene_type:complete
MRSISLALGLLLSLSFSTQADVSATPIAAADAKKQTIEKTIDLVIDTSMGKIEVELNAELAPISVANFMQYVESGFYNGTIFHRVINNFMVQGGGFDKFMQKKTTLPAIKNEAKNGLKNDRGTLAMARTGIVDSATSQFFINHKDNDFLNHGGRDYGYAVFGKVTKGMDVVDAIARVQTKSGDVPVNPVAIKNIQLKEAPVAIQAQ